MDNSRQAGSGTEGLNDDLETQGTILYSAVDDNMDITANTINGAEGSIEIESSTLNFPPPSYEEVVETVIKEKCRGNETKGKQVESMEENE